MIEFFWHISYVLGIALLTLCIWNFREAIGARLKELYIIGSIKYKEWRAKKDA